jgi:hypothetical protein
MATNLWQRTAFTQIDGAVETADGDWPLFVDSLPAARIYRVRGGPHDGRWFWAVQIGAGRVPFNSGADDGREAREVYCGTVLRQPTALIQAAKDSSPTFALATRS